MQGSDKEMSPVVARSLPFALYLFFLALESMAATVVPDFDVRWLYPAKVTLVATALLMLWPHYAELQPWRISLVHVALSLMTGLIILGLWVNLDAGWMLIGDLGDGYKPMDGGGQPDYVLIAFRILGAALVVPIMEELFWRSFIMRWIHQVDFIKLEPAQIGIRALLITSLLFAVEHTQWLAGLVAGLAYGGLYIYTRKLWAPILAHAVTNAGLGMYVLVTRRWQFW